MNPYDIMSEIERARDAFFEVEGYYGDDTEIAQWVENRKIKKAISEQIGGNHYQLPIQPIEYITKNNLGYIEGNIIKYVTRYKNKNGVEDLKKARHYLDMLIEGIE